MTRPTRRAGDAVEVIETAVREIATARYYDPDENDIREDARRIARALRRAKLLVKQ
jgi:hypothetical protein